MKAVIGQKHPYKAKKSRKELSYWKNCIIKVAQQPHKPIGGSNQIWATTSFKNICHSNLWLLSWGCKRQQLIAISESLHVSQECLWACGRGDVSTPSFGSHLNRISIRLCPHYTGLHTMFWKPHARLSVVLEPSTQGLISNSLYVILTWLPDYSRVSPCVSFFFYFKRLDWWSRKSICYGKYVLHLHCYVHENSHSFIHDMNSLVSCYRIIFEFYPKIHQSTI